MSGASPSIHSALLVAHKKIPPRGRSVIATILILGITIFSGACLLTLCLSRPIFANESPSSFQINESAKTEMQESMRWEMSLTAKYPKTYIARPAAGVAHIKTTKYIAGQPVRVNIVEINPVVNKNLVIKPETAGDILPRRAQISRIANKNNSVAAINAGYFKPETGVPLGTLMIDGKMLTGPIYERVAMGINQQNGYTDFVMGRIGLSIQVRNKFFAINADNINQPRMLSTYTLVYTPEWGEYSPLPPKYGSVVAIEDGKISAISSTAVVAIPKNGFVISAPAEVIKKLIPEKNLKLEIQLPQDFQNTNHIVSGGPYLVKDGEIFIDTAAQKLNAINGKNPRSAIGYTKEGVLIMIAVDGRENQSVGMTLNELAYMMKGLGCLNAMNLDGGGSTVMYVNGTVTNSPAQKGGIPISNALVVSEKPSQYAAAANLTVQ